MKKCIKKEKNYIIAENLLLDKTCYNCVNDDYNKNYSCRNHKELKKARGFSASWIFIDEYPIIISTSEQIEKIVEEIQRGIDNELHN